MDFDSFPARLWPVVLLALGLSGCAATGARVTGEQAASATSAQEGSIAAKPFPSTYKPLASKPTLIRNATVLTATGEQIAHGAVLMENGKIVAVGRDLTAPEGAQVIDGTGKWVTPGIIDVHSHLGVYASPHVRATADGNEVSGPNTAQVWSEHGIWTQDPQFPRALAGGVTAMQILPGSANLFGGRSVVVKNVPARTVQAMKFPGAPQGLKMACGENPKRVYGSKGQAPYSRMGNVAGYRAAWAKAVDYKRDWERYFEKKKKDKNAKPPKRDLQMETLVGVLNGEILVHMHCYRGDEMAIMLDVAKEFGYKITAFHHAVEAYKVADLLAENGVCAAMWADWWGFKLEAYDGIKENIPLVDAAGACAIVHSDSATGIQRLNQEAAKALADGNAAGLNVSKAHAIEWITLNPAKALAIDKQTGSLEPGKMADVVLWTGDPFSVYSHAEKVFIDGALIYDRDDPALQPVTDFELGQDQ